MRHPSRDASRQRAPAVRGAPQGRPLEAPATTIDSQCGSSEQATNRASDGKHHHDRRQVAEAHFLAELV